MRFGSTRRRFSRRDSIGEHHPGRHIEFHRLRDERWNKHRLWWYLAILIIVLLLFKFLRLY